MHTNEPQLCVKHPAIASHCIWIGCYSDSQDKIVSCLRLNSLIFAGEFMSNTSQARLTGHLPLSLPPAWYMGPRYAHHRSLLRSVNLGVRDCAGSSRLRLLWGRRAAFYGPWVLLQDPLLGYGLHSWIPWMFGSFEDPLCVLISALGVSM
jgi:hypothetical protein